MKCRSEWQMPATAVRIRTSRGPGFCRLTSSITSGLLTSCRTAAFIGVSPFVYRYGTVPSSPLPMGEVKFALVVGASLRRQNQFANLAHANGAFAEQMVRDR